MKPIVVLTLAVILGALPCVAAADNLSIQADQTLVEDGGARKVLRGDVVIEFRDFSFTADEVVQHFEGGAPVRYEASGSPVRVTQAGEAMSGLEEGTAETLVYLVAERTLLLTNYELRLSGGHVQRGREFRMVLP
jgi:lipopolysaccharide export system protein LptA